MVYNIHLWYISVGHQLSDNPKWTSVAFPRKIVEAIRELIEELKYWPSVSSFCREAVLEKIDKDRRKLKRLRGNERQARADEFLRLAYKGQGETASKRTRPDEVIDKERRKLKELKAERREPGVETC